MEVRPRLPHLSLLLGLSFILFLNFWSKAQPLPEERIKVGVLFSSTGTMAVNEGPLREATLLAIDEINQNGITLASERRLKLEPVLADGASSPQIFAERAADLVEHQGVKVIFGCWTSDCRKAVLKVLEPRQGLLYYPVQFEGLETSPAAIYSGLTANQQLFPALRYLSNEGPPRVFMVGSDYLYPRATNKLCRDYLREHGGTVVGEQYRPRGSNDFESITSAIQKSQCTVVLNTINGDSQRAFFQAYKQAQVAAPVMSLSLSESQAAELGDLTDGHLTCWGYFMSLRSPQNARFCLRFKSRFGLDRVVDDPCATAYTQVVAFAQALVRCGRAEPAALRQATRALILDSPGGLIRYDPKNLYCWRAIRIGRLKNGHAQIVWSSELPVRPEPFPGVEP